MVSNSLNSLTVKTSTMNNLCSKLHQDDVFRPTTRQAFTEFLQTIGRTVDSGQTAGNETNATAIRQLTFWRAPGRQIINKVSQEMY